ncbi:competence type IV pilus assembly protein ComGB [Planococcus sp. APC 3906]|uniref:competence type IV pilus assembly protein ComGB n=1 Tax=Planococcus sp. APC 3906 TaxID=3035194 RepID=UPI0025B380EC|nr:competence type IV pilus assembly protein ComGB [Planococcus sp. APC 3906]MDN3449889.1 competence type IV pilus assembly protein ComGB [Planococcus sp. APC 3906]
MPLKLLQRNKRIIFRDRENFLSRLAVLLREGYLLPTALTLLLPMHTPKLDEALNGVTSILKGGGNAAEILKFLGFKDNVLFPVEIAEHHGRLPESIDSISKSFSRTEQVQKKLRNILVYPVSLLFFTSGLFLFFRTSYVPNLEKLMASLNADGEGAGVPAYLLNLPDLFISCFAIAGIGASAFAAMLRKMGPAQKIAWLTRLPVLRKTMVFYWSHLLSRELGTLLHSGISLQESLQLLQKQNHHSIIQFMAEVCRSEVVTGVPLSDALRRHPFFAPDMAAFVQHGEMAGFLGKELILYSEVMMERIEAQTQRLLKIIQPAFFIMIAACIIGAYLAILLPMYNLVHTI